MIQLLHNHCSHCCRINNAGSNGYKYGVLGDYTDAELVNIVETNVLGVMLGCREVLHKAHVLSIHAADTALGSLHPAVLTASPMPAVAFACTMLAPKKNYPGPQPSPPIKVNRPACL